MGLFTESLEQTRLTVASGRRCKVRKLADMLDAEDREAFESWETSDGEYAAQQAIATGLSAATGIRIVQSTVRQHLRRECMCYSPATKEN
jgi:hypothetical protein